MLSKKRFCFTILAIVLIAGIALFEISRIDRTNLNAVQNAASPDSAESIRYAPNEITETFHPLKKFVDDSTGYPNVAYPMSFKFKGDSSLGTYNVEGYVADIYAAQKNEPEQWPRQYHYLIDFLAQFLYVSKDESLGQKTIQGVFVYTMDPVGNSCPKGWSKKVFNADKVKCTFSTPIPIIHYTSDNANEEQKRIRVIQRLAEGDSIINYYGCEAGTPKKTAVIGLPGEDHILCFGVKDDKSDFVYSVYKERYEEGNYLYYVATEKKRSNNPECQKVESFDFTDTLSMKLFTDMVFKQKDPDHCFLYERNEDISGVCNEGWRPYRYIASYADSSAQIEIYCYYKIPEQIIKF